MNHNVDSFSRSRYRQQHLDKNQSQAICSNSISFFFIPGSLTSLRERVPEVLGVAHALVEDLVDGLLCDGQVEVVLLVVDALQRDAIRNLLRLRLQKDPAA